MPLLSQAETVCDEHIAQPGHPGTGPELLLIEQVNQVHEHHPIPCRHCGTLLEGEVSDPLLHQVIEIPQITPLVVEHRLHRLVCPCCSTSTCATLPPDVESSRYGRRLSGLVGLLGSAFPFSVSKTQTLLDQLLGIEMSRGAIAQVRQRLSGVLAQPTAEVLQAARQQPVASEGLPQQLVEWDGPDQTEYRVADPALAARWLVDRALASLAQPAPAAVVRASQREM